MLPFGGLPGAWSHFGGPPRPPTVVHGVSVIASTDAIPSTSPASITAMIRSIAASPVVVPVGTPGVAVACGAMVAVGGTVVAVADPTGIVERGVSPATVAVGRGASSPPHARRTGIIIRTSNHFMHPPYRRPTSASSNQG